MSLGIKYTPSPAGCCAAVRDGCFFGHHTPMTGRGGTKARTKTISGTSRTTPAFGVCFTYMYFRVHPHQTHEAPPCLSFLELFLGLFWCCFGLVCLIGSPFFSVTLILLYCTVLQEFRPGWRSDASRVRRRRTALGPRQQEQGRGGRRGRRRPVHPGARQHPQPPQRKQGPGHQRAARPFGRGGVGGQQSNTTCCECGYYYTI